MPKLEQARLATRRDGRWHLLAPVREALLQAYPPDATDKARLVKLFLARAAFGRYLVGRFPVAFSARSTMIGNVASACASAVGEDWNTYLKPRLVMRSEYP